MKRRKNIQGVFVSGNVEYKLDSAIITAIEEYLNKINDFNVFYTYSGVSFQISFTDGDVDLTPTTTTTTEAPAETTTTTTTEAPAETTTTTTTEAPAETTTTTTSAG